MLSVSHSVDFNNMWPILTGLSNNLPKEGGSVLKYVHLQDNIVYNVSGHVNDDDLEDYCCIKKFKIVNTFKDSQKNFS